LYQQVRDGVTDDFNMYIRRNLEYAVGVVEYFDLNRMKRGDKQRLWFEKKAITALEIRIDPLFTWGDDTIVDPSLYTLDPVRGNVVLYPVRNGTALPGVYCGGNGIVKATYTGGYAEAGGTGVFKCPATLKAAAVEECVYRLNDIINKQSGNQQEQQRDIRTQKQHLIGGVLPQTARKLDEYRKTMAASS
jgi:hypothetical protein